MPSRQSEKAAGWAGREEGQETKGCQNSGTERVEKRRGMLVSRQADVSRLVFIVAHLLLWLLHLACGLAGRYKWNNCLLYLETPHSLSLQYPQQIFKIGNESENQSSVSGGSCAKDTFRISPQN